MRENDEFFFSLGENSCEWRRFSKEELMWIVGILFLSCGIVC